MMNEQTKKTGRRLNFFDILLIVLILLIAVGVILFFSRSFAGLAMNKSHKTPVHYTVLVKDIPVSMNMTLDRGQEVINSVDLNPLGTIVQAEMLPCVYDQFNQIDRVLYHGAHEDFHNVAVTIETTAEETEDDYLIDNMHVCIGTIIYFRTSNFVGYGYVTDLTVVDTPVFAEREGKKK